MMVLSIIVLLLSLIIQGTALNYMGYIYTDLSWLSTIYLLVAFLVLRPYFENEKKYLILLIIFGLIIDIVYTNTFIFNTCLFVLIYYFSKAFHFFFPYNVITLNISSLLGVFIYHIISFIFLTILNYDNYTIGVLLKILSHSILMTIIYTSLVYFITNFFKEKFDLREVK